VLLAATAVHPVYSPRYIMFCAPAAALLAGAGLASLGWAGGAAGLALIVLVALPGQAGDRRVSSHGENLRLLSRQLAAHSRPGDALLFPRLTDHEFEAAYPSAYRPLRDVGLAQTPTQSATLPGTAAPAPVVRHRLTTVHRLWVIETGNERGHVPLLNGAGFHLTHRWTVSGIWLELDTRPGPATATGPCSDAGRNGRGVALRELLLAPDDLASRRAPGAPAQRELADDLQAAPGLVVPRRVPHPRQRR
jgi:mannosyltransferase